VTAQNLLRDLMFERDSSGKLVRYNFFGINRGIPSFHLFSSEPSSQSFAAALENYKSDNPGSGLVNW